MIPKVTRLTGLVRVTVLLFFLHKGPLRIKLDRSWPEVLNLLSVEALCMAATGFEQPRHGFLRHFRQSRGGPDIVPFVEMVNDFLGFGFPDFGMEQGGVASFRELFPTTAAAQQTKAIFAIDLPNGEVARAWAGNMLAFDVDTG
jgi:hypothetical protein